LQSHWTADVHLEIAWSKESYLRALLLASRILLAHRADDKTGSVYTEEQVEESNEDSRGEESNLCDSRGGQCVHKVASVSLYFDWDDQNLLDRQLDGSDGLKNIRKPPQP
jgi:hypothetical protein